MIQPTWYAFLAIGTTAGVLSGFFGIGGGLVIVPALVWLLGFSQHQAQGMSLAALLLPVGLLGFLNYHKAHPFSVKMAFLIALGIFVGAYLGSYLAQDLPEKQLKMAFGVFITLAGLKMMFGK